MRQRLLSSAVIGPFVALILVVIVVSLTTDRFLLPQNLSNITLQVSIVALAAIGATLVMLAGGIDLSPGSVLALTSCTLAILVKNWGWPVEVAIPATLLLGALLGLFNGVLSAYLRIPAFVVTLATLTIYRGMAFLITGGTPIFSISPKLRPIFYGSFLGVPLPLYYVLAAFVLTALFLRYTVPGRAIYAVGGNESAARFTGIKVNRTRLLTFVIAGLMAAAAGVLTTARLDSGSPNYGVGLELQAIAAAVIGGASLAGGSGTIIATLFGALIVAVVQNGLNLNAVPASWQQITLGTIILMAVGLDMWRKDLGGALRRLFSWPGQRGST